MGVEFPHGLWKTVLMHDMRDNIHILKKNGSWVSTKHLQTQKCMAIQKVYLTLPRACLDRHVPLHTECLVDVWSVGSCVLSLLKYFIHSIRCTQDTTGVSQGHFRHSFHWDGTFIYPAILFLPMSNGSLHILEFFPLQKKKKKCTLLSFISGPKSFAFNEKKS